jgi:hypothetical protein
MWGPRLKYHLRDPKEGHPTIVFVPGSLCGWSLGRFLWCRHLDPLCLAATLPFLTCACPILSHCIGGAASDQLYEGCKAPESSDSLGCWPSGSLVDRILCGEACPYRVSSSDIRVIITIMRVFMVKLLCQVVTGQVPVLECLLLGTRGRQWLCLVLSDIKWPCYPRIPTLGHLPGTGNPEVWLREARVCAEPRLEEKLDRGDRWWDPTYPWPLRGIRGLMLIVPEFSLF